VPVPLQLHLTSTFPPGPLSRAMIVMSGVTKLKPGFTCTVLECTRAISTSNNYDLTRNKLSRIGHKLRLFLHERPKVIPGIAVSG
jgi:hypothetical protein